MIVVGSGPPCRLVVGSGQPCRFVVVSDPPCRLVVGSAFFYVFVVARRLVYLYHTNISRDTLCAMAHVCCIYDIDASVTVGWFVLHGQLNIERRTIVIDIMSNSINLTSMYDVTQDE